MRENIGEASNCGRWNRDGDEWHQHVLVHVHPTDDGEGHHHIIATDEETMGRLTTLLESVTRGWVGPDERAEARALLALTSS